MKTANPDSGFSIQFAVIADDNTGATDAAGMLTEKGVRTLLILNKNYLAPQKIPKDFDAYVYSTATRSLAPEIAYRETALAIERFRISGAKKIQIKYSSTFDSTPKGNIGPSLDAALDVLHVKTTTVSPALPINGRTTYFGYHFVNGVLISESPLRHHPLNPITDPSLVRWLSKQTNRRVGLAPLSIIRRGEKELSGYFKTLSNDGISYIVTDTINQEDLKTIARSTKEWPLISGGSGITAEMPELLFKSTKLSDQATRRELKLLNNTNPRTLIAAGSCTPTTIKQNAYAIRAGFKAFKLDAEAILRDRINLKEEAKRILNETEQEEDILIYTSSELEEVEKNKKLGSYLGLNAEETGKKIVTGLAYLIGEIMTFENFGKLCISGGETSGVICKHLGINALEVGFPIEPGIPYCFTIPKTTSYSVQHDISTFNLQRKTLVVLKSGNFGSEEFYEKVRNL